MTRLMILTGALVALLAACGPPTPGIESEMQNENELRDTHYR